MSELIILPQLKALPYGGMLQTAPISQEEAVGWAQKYQAEKVYYWPRTKSAFIVSPVERPGSSEGDHK